MELEQDNVRIRELRYADRAQIASLANNKKIWNRLRDKFPHPYTIHDAEKFIDAVKNKDPLLNFAIEWKFEFVGIIGLVEQQDVYRNSAEVGYWIGEPYWNQGVASIAVRLVAEYARKQLKLKRLYATVFEGNSASVRVLEKCGFGLEGISRKAVFKNKKFLDELRFAKIL